MAGSIIELRGAKLHLRRAGTGEPLLFLHGVQGLPESTAALDRLSRRFTVLAPDHPGFGASDSPDRVQDVADLALFYLDFLEALDLKSVHLIGHSLGGWIALELAIRSSARVTSLTLAATAGIRVAGVPRGDMFIASPAELTRLLFADEGAGAQWFASWQATPGLMAAYDRNRAAAAKYTWQPRLYDPKLEHWLHRVGVPTHIVWGEADSLIPPAHAAALGKLVPGAATTLLPGCGHMLDIERPDLFAETVLRFIEGLRS